jgi:predicted DNA-binding transcriptional regulator AlpA
MVVDLVLLQDHREYMLEILTVDEVAAMLKISKSKVYELANARNRAGDLRENPLPVVKFGSCVRFRRSDIEAWVEKLASNGK